MFKSRNESTSSFLLVRSGTRSASVSTALTIANAKTWIGSHLLLLSSPHVPTEARWAPIADSSKHHDLSSTLRLWFPEARG